MKPELEAAIQRQWADDEEYVESCQLIALEVADEWEVEARLRSPRIIPPFLLEKLRREWREVAVLPTATGGEELLLRREQTLTLDAVKQMSGQLVRLAHTYGLEWLNWSEFDGRIYRSLHRTLSWTFAADD